MPRKVFLPSVLLADAARILEEGGLDLVHALPEELRAVSGGNPDVQARRRAAVEEGVAPRLAEAHVLSEVMA